jgi:putative flavoprotein involved in K+ transport
VDVVVVGAGVIGLAIARAAAERDHSVVVLERERIGAGASTIQPGGVRQQWGTAIACRLARESVAFWRDAGDRLASPVPLELRRSGYLFVALGEETLARLTANVRVQNAEGVPSRIVSPEEAARLVPGLAAAELAGGAWCDEDGYFDRPQSVVEAFATGLDVRIHAVESLTPAGDGWLVGCSDSVRLAADRVVVAAGSFHAPRIPAISSALPPRIAQLHSHHYRRESALPPGGVLVVGSGQSGVQIAEELAEAGRGGYMSVGTAGRVPRRYRGKDLFHWLAGLGREGPRVGIQLPTVDKLPDARLRLAGNPHLSGHNGGHDTNLREFAARGMTLLGRIVRVDGERLVLARDLAANLARADRFFDERFRESIDAFIAQTAPDTPPDDRRPFEFEPPDPSEIDLAGEDITSVVWTSGYRLDYGWIDAPITDELGIPRQKRGVTEIPGLYFIGLLWQHNQLSATLFGPGQDGPHIAAAMGVPVTDEPDATLVAS